MAGQLATDRYLLDVVQSSMYAADDVLHDQVMSSHIVTYLIQSRIKQNAISGGLALTKDVQIGMNTTIGMRNPYMPTPLKQDKYLGRVQFPWSHISGSLTVFDEDMRVNQQPHQIRSYVSTMMENLEESCTEVFAGLMYSDGTATDDGEVFLGLEALISASNSYGYLQNQDGTFTALNRALDANEWWRAQVMAVNGAFMVDGMKGVKHLLNMCRPGPGKPGPDTLLTTEAIFLAWLAKYEAKQPLTNPALADIGFDNIKVGNATLFWDDLVPGDQAEGGSVGDTLYALTSKDLDIVPDTENASKFHQSNWKDLPDGAPGQWKRVKWTGQLTAKRPKSHGKMTGIKLNAAA
jgi:hypothetical protein